MEDIRDCVLVTHAEGTGITDAGTDLTGDMFTSGITVDNLPKDITYTVTEADVENDGFALDETNSKNLGGIIEADRTKYASLVNKYTPSPANIAKIKIEI